MPSIPAAGSSESAPSGPDLARSVDGLDRLRVVVLRISRRIRGQARGDISPSQLAVLGTIITHQPITNGRVAEIEHVKPSTSSKVIDTLERAGLVERNADPADRRRTQITVTSAGHDYAEEVRAAGRSWLAQQIECLDDAEMRSIDAALPALERLLAGEDG